MIHSRNSRQKKLHWHKIKGPACAEPTYKVSKLLIYRFVLRDAHFRGDALGHKSLNHIAFLNVIEVLEIDTAFHAVAHFARIVFEALERTNLAFADLHRHRASDEHRNRA